MIISLKSITVDSFHIDFNTIEWELNDPVPTGDVVIKIYRCEAPTSNLSEFDEIGEVDVSEGLYVDNGVSDLESHHRKWYYNLKAVNNDTTEEETLLVNPVTWQDQPMDYAARRILELKTLSLERFTQRSFYLLKRRTWGTRCTECWDSTLQRATDPDCPTCKGTGWVSGYFDAVKFMGMATPSPKYNEILPFGEWKPGNILLTMLNFPNLVPKDIVVDDTGVRWNVVQRRSLEKLGRVIEQSVQLEKLEVDDISYTVNITPSDPEDLYVGYVGNLSSGDRQAPTYISPILSLSNGSVTEIYVESGTTLSDTLEPVWAQNDAGLASYFAVYKNAGFVVGSADVFDYDVDDIIGDETFTYYYRVDYGDGELKDDSLGDPYSIGQILAGTIQSNSVYYYGKRNLFVDVDGSTTNIRGLGTTQLDPQVGDVISLTSISGANIIIAYPDSLSNLSSAIFTSGGFDFNITDLFVRQTDQEVNDAGGSNPITYKVFKYEPVVSFTNIDITITI